MATDTQETVPAANPEDIPADTKKKASKPTVKAAGSSGTPAKKKHGKKKNKPGKYSTLVIDTIRKLGERNGSSLAKIYNEAKKASWFDQQNGRTYLRYSIKALLLNDSLIQVKGTGASGSFKLNKKKFEKSPVKKSASKSTKTPSTSAKKAAKPAEKKTKAKVSPKKKKPDAAAATAKKAAVKPKKAAKKPTAAKKVKPKKSTKPSVPKVPKAKKASKEGK